MKRVIKSNEINGFISAQMKSAKSITIVGDIGDTKVEHIRLIGEVEINGSKLVNPYVENLDGAIVSYHYKSEDGAIATIYFVDGVFGKVISDVQNYILGDFELEVDVCPCCGR